MNPSKTFKALMILIIAYMFFLTWFFVVQPVVPAAAEEIPGPEIKQGKYTLFIYENGGWANRLYITEYYIKDRIIFYKLREHQGEFMEAPFDNSLPAPGWVEDIDELMNYGWWEPGEY